jgi:membrane-associated phospholipid phosphatase
MSTLAIQRPRTYFAVVLTIGFALALTVPWLVVAAADAMPDKSVVAIFDDSVANWLIQNGTDGADVAFRFISLFGDWVLVAVVAAAAFRLAMRKRMPQLAVLLVGVAGAVLLNLVLAYTFRRAHSTTATDFVTVAQAVSFPSGHSMVSLVIYGMLAYFATLSKRLSAPRKMVSVIGAVVLVVLIGAARIYLGIHSVSDVVLGVVAGALWLTACIVGYPRVLHSLVASPAASPVSTLQPTMG